MLDFSHPLFQISPPLTREAWRDLVTPLEDDDRAALLLSTTGELRYGNPAALRLLGADPLAILSPAALGALQQHHSPQNITLQGDDGLCHLRCTSRTIWDRSGGLWLLIQLEDVTRLRALEEQNARLSSQLRSSTAQLTNTRLLEHATHDLSNVLQGLYLRMMELSSTARQESREQDISDLQDAASRSISLMRRLLRYAHDTAQSTLPADPTSTIENISSLLRLLLQSRITLHVSVDPGMRPLRTSAICLEQILLNLVLNAQAAIARGQSGTIWISAAAAEDSACILQVRDDGVGMSPELLSQALHPHFTTRPGEGNGLGLSIVRYLTERVGGTLTLDSAENLGTSITLRLPALD